MVKGISSPQNPEEVVENEANDYEMDGNDPKSDPHADEDTGRESKTARTSKRDNEDESTKKFERNRSDLSADEDESGDDDDDYDDDNKKRTDIAKS